MSDPVVNYFDTPNTLHTRVFFFLFDGVHRTTKSNRPVYEV